MYITRFNQNIYREITAYLIHFNRLHHILHPIHHPSRNMYHQIQSQHCKDWPYHHCHVSQLHSSFHRQHNLHGNCLLHHLIQLILGHLLLDHHQHLTHVDHALHHCLLLRENPLNYHRLGYTLPAFPLDRVSQQMTSPLYLEPLSKIPVQIGLEEHRALFLAQTTLYLPW